MCSVLTGDKMNNFNEADGGSWQRHHVMIWIFQIFMLASTPRYNCIEPHEIMKFNMLRWMPVEWVKFFMNFRFKRFPFMDVFPVPIQIILQKSQKVLLRENSRLTLSWNYSLFLKFLRKLFQLPLTICKQHKYSINIA